MISEEARLGAPPELRHPQPALGFVFCREHQGNVKAWSRQGGSSNRGLQILAAEIFKLQHFEWRADISQPGLGELITGRPGGEHVRLREFLLCLQKVRRLLVQLKVIAISEIVFGRKNVRRIHE